MAATGLSGMASRKIRRESKPFDSSTKELMENQPRFCLWFLLGRDVMKESVTYQTILREGKAEAWDEWKLEGKIEEAKRILLRQGRKRFGQPKASVKAQVESLADLRRLERLIDRVLDAKSWDDLICET
jgi:hypothetical protein